MRIIILALLNMMACFMSAMRSLSTAPGRHFYHTSEPKRTRWKKLEPHFDYQADNIGLIVEGRLVQAFVGNCESNKLVSLRHGSRADQGDASGGGGSRP